MDTFTSKADNSLRIVSKVKQVVQYIQNNTITMSLKQKLKYHVIPSKKLM